ncbi:DUF397 domain-containing protein [Actinoplanes sp. NPDC051851]|uniref:DUF397 domain-containing protein n=1 Tax=Actinoplanes sp. NPDC051851 TaxID=3154753 RepID=UPI003420665D
MVEPTLMWTRSSYCADSACVEAAPIGDHGVALRDSKDPGQPVLRISRADWHGFLDSITAGRYSDI